MSEGKIKYVKLWDNFFTRVDRMGLNDAQVGQLVRAMCDYQIHERTPMGLDPMTDILFGFMQEELDNARKKYMACVNNGKKGGRPKATNPEPMPEEPKPEEPDQTQVHTQENQTQPPFNITSHTSKRSSTSTSTRTSTRERYINTADGEANAAGEAADSLSLTAYGEFGWVKLTDPQYRELLNTLGAEELDRCITYIDEAAQTTNNRNRWKDWALVLRRCSEKRWHETAVRANVHTAPPSGATGHLGEAELEAIRRTLAWEPPEDLPALAME